MSEELSVLVTINQHNIALLFSDHLISQQITSKVVECDEGFAVLCAEADIEQAKALFKAFVQNPQHPKYQHNSWQQANVVEVKSTEQSLTDAAKANFFAHAGPITLAVFMSCWLIFILSSLGWGYGLFEQLKFFSQVDVATLVSAPYRIITPALFHFSLLHIAFNSLWWWQLGGDIERQLGKGNLLHVFLLTAIISNVGQFLVSGPNFGGLSGVVYGLFGYVWWLGWLKPELGLRVSNNIIGFLLIWLVLGYLNFLPVDMANTAHLLGLVSGCFLAYFKVNKLK